jgi:dienelactone hydrolase
MFFRIVFFRIVYSRTAFFRFVALLTIVLAIPLLTSPLLTAQDASLLRHFDYDQAAPLDIKESAVEHRGDISIHDISYASPKGGRVPAYLVVPGGRGPFAAMIWGHWYMEGSAFRNRKEFLDEAVVLARAGVVSLLSDGPIARPGHVENNNPLNDQGQAELVQSIVDMRRGADLLLARSDVASNRLAYVGHSYNARVGGILSGIDRRFKAFVLMAGDLSHAVDMRSKEFQDYRQEVGPPKFDDYAAKYSWLNTEKYVSHAAPATVFLQYASREDFLNPGRAKEYAAAVSEPKKLKIYDAPHALNAEARRDRITFLAEQLHFKPPDPALIAGVPDLIQPPDPPHP